MEKFYLGLDIGTESVGMACTDENYNLLRAKGKDLWSVRLFDPAKDASERRTKRTARRRLQRRRQRIEFLQGIFAPYMVDTKFFIRLNNSGFYKEDKQIGLNTKYSLFADQNFNDKTFYVNYPTIFHLRKYLMEKPADKKADLRIYYLALHHIIKYRGHFLFDGENVGELRNVKLLFEKHNLIVEELSLNNEFLLDVDKADEFKKIATKVKSVTDKKKQITELFSATTTAQKELVVLLSGGTATAVKLFGEEYSDKYAKEKLSFKDFTDEQFEEKREVYEEDHFSLIESLRNIYNFIVFEKVLLGHSNVSSAMIAIYDKHKDDLRLLKDFIKKEYAKEVFDKVFRDTKNTANYVNYIGYNIGKKSKTKEKVKKCNKVEDFYKNLKKILLETPVTDEETLNYILSEIDSGTFLPKIIKSDNGLFPHQINGMELDLILQNLGKDYPEFTVKDSDGFSALEKIKKIFLFKIPYYVGPLSEKENGNAWMVRKKEGKITPWNFDQIVDKAQSNEKFIRKMTNKCSFLHAKDVLPKCSMYYQAFDALNQLNKFTINGEPISVSLKQELFKEVFLKNKKVTPKLIKDYLVSTGKIAKEELKELVLGGFDGQINASMNSYVTFKNMLGDFVDERPDVCEKIILWHTLNTDKSLVEKLISDEYGSEKIIKDNLKKLKGITSFKDFGRLSKELLCDLSGGIDCVTGENYTVLRELYHTNYNFEQLLHAEEYTFSQAIDDENSGKSQDVTYEDIKELYVAPMVRRGIWQALQMVDEYVSAVGKAPDKIFIEVTRHDQEKKRTVSRKARLSELYGSLSKDSADVEDLIKELNREEYTDARLRQERLYLYFLQLGKCAYTGERIDLESLSGDMYDVDHIMPRSITKDDSLENKVLVKRELNSAKSDTYPLPQELRSQQPFWKYLKDKGLMSEKKYKLLTRTKELSEDDFREFINRQMVVTNQTVKAVAELLKRKYGPLGSKIVYSKAVNVDDFKQKHDIVKCRETNDLHHARDAYLNVVVGNVYDTKFTCARDYYYRNRDNAWREYNLKELFNRPTKNAWNGANDIERVKAIASKTSMQVTRYAFSQQGSFYNETVYGKQDNGIVAPRKQAYPYNDVKKYGGFKSLSTAYFCIVLSKDKKGNLIKTIEAVPILIEFKQKNGEITLTDYFVSNGLVEPKIIVPKLKIKTLISVNGYKVWIAGMTGPSIIVHNAQQWFTNQKTDIYVKTLLKVVERDREGKTISFTKINSQENITLYDLIIEKLQKPSYSGLSAVNSFVKKLIEKRELFTTKNELDQAKILLQLVRFMKANAECADLSLLNDGATCGKLLISKNITNVNFAIIHQSPCGLVERIQKV